MKKSYLPYHQRNKQRLHFFVAAWKRKRLLVADNICALATASVLSLLLTSCSHTRYIPLPEHHSRDSLSVVVHKKVNNTFVDRTHTLVQRGDTIFKTDSIYVEKFTDIEVHDTIRVTQTDSIPYPVEVPKYIHKRNLYDRTTSAGFWILLAGIILFISVRSLVYF